MLVLSRHSQEEIVIETPSGEKIRVRVVRIDRGIIRLGFIADRAVKVYRAELEGGEPCEAHRS